MKKTLLYVTGIIILSIFFSCKKDTTLSSDDLSNDEAAEIAAASLSSDNGGSAAQFEDAAHYSETIINDTTQKSTSSYDTTFTISKDTGRITFNYTFHYQYGIQYNSETHQFEFFMNYDTDGLFESLKLYSEDNSEGSVVLTGLEEDSDFYAINGNVTRTGEQTVKLQTKKTVTATTVFNFNNIKIRKSDYVITEGSGDITVKGKTSEGKEFSFTGTIIYKDDGTIILNLNGEEYIINLSSGEIQG